MRWRPSRRFRRKARLECRSTAASGPTPASKPSSQPARQSLASLHSRAGLGSGPFHSRRGTHLQRPAQQPLVRGVPDARQQPEADLLRKVSGRGLKRGGYARRVSLRPPQEGVPRREWRAGAGRSAHLEGVGLAEQQREERGGGLVGGARREEAVLEHQPAQEDPRERREHRGPGTWRAPGG